jgi:hypothetical protein
MLRTQLNVNATDADHIYVDMQAINDDRTGTDITPRLYINEARSNPILMNASEYYLSIIRFNLQTGSLPVMLPQVDLTQSDPTKLIYEVCLSFDGIDASQNLIWIPQDFNASPPAVPLNYADINSPYYNCFSYQHFIFACLDKAFQNAFTKLQTLATAAGKTLPSSYAPFMEWNPDAGKAIIDADVLGYDQSLAKPIEIYFNTPLYSLFSSFDALYFGTNVSNGKNYKLTMYNMMGGNIYNLNGVNYLQAYQEWPTFQNASNPISSIVFVSTQIPVLSTNTAKPVVYNELANVFSSQQNAGFSNMITDFEIAVDPGSLYKNAIAYNPTAQYRYFDLISNNPIQNIDITVFWKDNYGKLNPFTLAAQNTFNMKLLFKRKSLSSYDKF